MVDSGTLYSEIVAGNETVETHKLVSREGKRMTKWKDACPWGLQKACEDGDEGEKSRSKGMFDLAPTSGAVEAACG